MLVVLLLLGVSFTTVIASADRRNKAESSKLQAAVAANHARLDAPASLGDTVTYHGKLLVVRDAPTSNWDSAAGVCHEIGAVPAPALSKHLMSKIQDIIPKGYDKDFTPLTSVGLKQKWGQPSAKIGWQWIEQGPSRTRTIDIDTGNTVKPLWLRSEPSGDGKYGFISNGYAYGIKDAAIVPNKDYRHVLCQFEIQNYEYTMFRNETRLTFPHESTMTDVSFSKCRTTCGESAFCRAFSFSFNLNDCRHHSSPPNDAETNSVRDKNFNIYA